MPAAIGPRFVLEAGFLVLLAVVVGIADLDPLLIVLVMAVGWLLVSLIEYFAWRQQAVAVRRFEAAPGAVLEEAVVEDVPPPPVVEDAPPPPPPAPVEEETIVAPPPEEPAPEPVAEEPEAPVAPMDEEPAVESTGFTAPSERRVGHRLEPLQPRPRRRWGFFGPYERRKPADDSEEER